MKRWSALLLALALSSPVHAAYENVLNLCLQILSESSLPPQLPARPTLTVAEARKVFGSVMTTPRQVRLALDYVRRHRDAYASHRHMAGDVNQFFEIIKQQTHNSERWEFEVHAGLEGAIIFTGPSGPFTAITIDRRIVKGYTDDRKGILQYRHWQNPTGFYEVENYRPLDASRVQTLIKDKKDADYTVYQAIQYISKQIYPSAEAIRHDLSVLFTYISTIHPQWTARAFKSPTGESGFVDSTGHFWLVKSVTQLVKGRMPADAVDANGIWNGTSTENQDLVWQ